MDHCVVPIVGMDAEVPAGTVVIVIDVIRAFTTAAVAFERGATDAMVGDIHQDHVVLARVPC